VSKDAVMSEWDKSQTIMSSARTHLLTARDLRIQRLEGARRISKMTAASRVQVRFTAIDANPMTWFCIKSGSRPNCPWLSLAAIDAQLSFAEPVRLVRILCGYRL
jgi:hypothetical protein